MKESDINWCRELFNALAIGGVWGVPRSNLTFKKTSEDTLTLVEVAPPLDEADLGDPQEWIDYQKEDFELIRAHFNAAGVKVRDGLRVFD